ncbi:uncharacterized protein HMPREF1541_08237 [Cyphellophora europaea CBS 101466]|uniref:Glutathione S-transferase n=1 Tax=Cyphellophora europaea (strain CBS 101466) TaxID=1220924 RepID=W2RL72_CYPE1|nr:uncharacterized protein HMPREF1541_08237 [Cyphellophora europaea CBS 101466]ETN37246.1 hypothetical protein HMPREF1541_08237 [Cyphellophora europaea CBS 101466]
MTLTVYYLHWSQGDRIIWLCEELTALIPDFKYELHVFPRGLEESEGKQTLVALHPSGTSPTLKDTNVSPPIVITESQAILMYIIDVYGSGTFALNPSAGPHIYSQYLYWLCFANGSMQAFLSADIYAASLLNAPGFPTDTLAANYAHQSFIRRTPNHLKQYNDRLATNTYLAGDDFSAADMMNIYCFTLLRVIYPIDLSEYPHIRRWLKLITSRPAYRRAMDKGEDGMPALVTPTVPQLTFPVLLSVAPWNSVPELVKMKEEQDAEDKAKVS